MKIKVGLLGIAFGFLVLGLSQASAQEEKKVMEDNPLYKYWSAFKVGAYSTLSTKTVMDNQVMESQMTIKLVELTPKKAVLEIKNVVPGIDIPAQKMDVPAKWVKGDPATQPGAGQEMVTTEGEETIEVAGNQMKTKWTQIVIKSEQGTTTTKTWTNEEIPGSTVKSEITLDGPVKSKTVMNLTEYQTGATTQPAK